MKNSVKARKATDEFMSCHVISYHVISCHVKFSCIEVMPTIPTMVNERVESC